MSEQHTPEPWGLLEVGDSIKFMMPHHNQESILTCAVETTERGPTFFGAVYNPADARRIVACVNACKGVTNEELQAADLRVAVLANVMRQRDQLKAERDALVKFIECEADALDEAGMSTDGYRFREFVTRIKAGQS